MKHFFVLYFLFAFPLIGASQSVVINEVMATNTLTIKDNKGNYSDWIELKNNSEQDYDLASHFISDNKSKITKFQFTEESGQVVIPAGGYLIIWASGNVEDGPEHTSFSLSSNGEDVVLTLPDGKTIIDSVSFPALSADMSYGLNSSSSWVYFTVASPGRLNSDSHGYNGFLSPPVFSRPGGFFAGEFELSLVHDDPDVKIIYTLDGSDPSELNLDGKTYFYKNHYPEHPGSVKGGFLERSLKSEVYSNPILVYDRSNDENQISQINSTIKGNSHFIPQYRIPKAFIVRASAFKDGFLSSEVISNTYIFNQGSVNPYTFPITSVITSENNLFDYVDGIYTPGKVFDDVRDENPYEDLSFCTSGNFKLKGKETQKTGNFEVYGLNYKTLNVPVDIRINGGCTTGFPYKSLRLYGSNRFDNFNFFSGYPNSFQHRLLLRNSGNDQYITLFKDGFVREWVKDLNFSTQKFQPSILYLNGEYWGIHNIRERIDKYFLSELYGVDPENIDLIKLSFDENEASEGDFTHFDFTFNFILNNDIKSESNYKYIQTLIDLDSFTDFYIVHSYIGNVDWPQNNIRLWRTKNDYKADAGYFDGRWRYIFFDSDRSLGETVPAINNDFMNNGIFSRENSQVLSKLLENSNYKHFFINRLADLMNTIFRPEFGIDLFEQVKKTYQPEMERHISRWKSHQDLNEWENQCEIVRRYISERNNLMFNMHMGYAERFGLFNVYNVKIVNSDPDRGFVKLNSIEIDSHLTRGIQMEGSTWSGKYFGSVPIVVKAISKPGFTFKHWEYNGSKLYDQELSIISYSDIELKPHFEFTGFHEGYPEALEIKSVNYQFSYWDGESPKATYPEHSAFINKIEEKGSNDSQLINSLSFIWGKYNLKSGTRINGLDDDGVSFINSRDTNEGYENSGIGGFIVALNTKGVNNVFIQWSAKTIESNQIKSGLRLMYRLGDKESFRALGFEYKSGNAGHSAVFEGIRLPNRAIGQDYIQLFWEYYEIDSDESLKEGDRIALKEISIIEDKTQFIELPPYDLFIKVEDEF